MSNEMIKPDPGNKVRIAIRHARFSHDKEVITDAILLFYDSSCDPWFLIPHDVGGIDYSQTHDLSDSFIERHGLDKKLLGRPMVYFFQTDTKFGEVLKDFGRADSHDFSFGHASAALVCSHPDGMRCCLCKEPNNYALPNLGDGRYACYQCRTTKQWML
jgi:hypothetical protein